ncbi:enoyl-CoA hydratase [Mycobacterium sp.]|uniref:enoyl-CoA hydratase n=1 Tax=Mycobacterium sp. TaxID=1785 RepID=UPI003A883A3B
MPDSPIAALAGVDGLDVTLADGVLSVTINRPDSLNSLIIPVISGLADTMEVAATDPGVRVVRLGGAGRGFSSGAGISADDLSGGGGLPPDHIIVEINRLIRAITVLPHPVVAVVQGPTAGVGVSLALACDIVLASEKAFFMLAFTKIALMPDGGASSLVAAAVGRIRAMKMALLPERLTAAEARSWGLVTEVFPAGEFDAEVDKVIARLVAGPAVAFARTKAAINAATLTGLDAALERELQGQTGLLRARDFSEGTKAFQDRRAPRFTDS